MKNNNNKKNGMGMEGFYIKDFVRLTLNECLNVKIMFDSLIFISYNLSGSDFFGF